MPARRRRPMLFALVLLAVAGFLATAVTADDGRGSAPAGPDRYDVAGQCYVLRSVASGGYVGRAGTTFLGAATRDAAEPFHFQAYDLGKYLLFAAGADSEYLAAAADPIASGTAELAGDAALAEPRRQVRGDGVVVAGDPSAFAEWVLQPAGDGTFAFHQPVDDHEPENPGPANPDIAATLVADAEGMLTVVDGALTSNAARFHLEPATGCATFPEIEVNVTGEPASGATPYEQTQGYVDAHLHMMAFEFLGGRARCGRPWHPYGVTYALVDCADHEPGGYGAVLEQVLAGGPGGHDTTGWPTFGYWPKHDSLTHEQVYYRWLERAWRGGLRMFTNLLVDNGVLCEIYPYKKNSCNEMDGVRLQAQRLRELERYIDAQSGGPGEGWFRIVTDPFQARRVINAGQLAVVMGIEVSVPFDCRDFRGTPQCSNDDIDRRLDEVYALGVRQMELTNKFDNGLTGVTGDNGAFGVVVNTGNRYETGHYWKMQTCAEQPANHGDHEHRHDKQQMNLADDSDGGIGRDAIFGAILKTTGPTGEAPLYPEGPHCNTSGLTDRGRHAIEGLIQRGMIFDPDHMSALARRAAMEHVAGKGYSGVVSSHSWADDPTYQAILRVGGVVTPHAGGAPGFVTDWRDLRGWAQDAGVRQYGIGFGSDINGFSVQGGGHDGGVAYPFTGLGGVIVGQQVSGQRTYDIDVDGVAHYGLYPDWVEDARLAAKSDGAAIVADLARGAEAYLQMWERAIGIRPNACAANLPDLTKAELKRVDKGMSPEAVLRALGQPESRLGNTFTYCAEGGAATIEFDDGGHVQHVRRP